MSESTNWQLLARYLSGECSPEEKSRIETWAAESTENGRLLNLMREVWSARETQQKESDVDALWQQVQLQAGINTVQASPARRLSLSSLMHADNYRVFRRAVGFMLIAVLGYALRSYMPWTQGGEFVTITVESGQREQLTLDDGTQVVLDAGSEFRYPGEFSGNKREVFLSGEGYFEVTHDASKPFVVNAQYAAVQVLGTRFNVSAWNGNRPVTVAVAEGKVSLRGETDSTSEGVVITPGFASSLIKDGRPTPPVPVNIDAYLGWMQNQINFEDTSLDIILRQLERWHGVQFVFADSSIAKERLTVHVGSASLVDVLDLLSALADFDYEMKGDVIQLARPGEAQN